MVVLSCLYLVVWCILFDLLACVVLLVVAVAFVVVVVVGVVVAVYCCSFHKCVKSCVFCGVVFLGCFTRVLS